MYQDAATLFIPDISGFSRFIDATELRHSQHIIAELLEALIEANELDLVVSEVEGDAVLFYRFGDPPSLEEVVGQAETMFLAFHSLLHRYERDRICDCKACTTTRKLSVKIVVHFGPISVIDVNGRPQLVGREVIVAHRLLKNDVKSHEYVLISEQLMGYYESTCRDLEASFDWIECEAGTSAYDVIGEVEYKYFSLSPLCHRLPKLPRREKPERFENKISVETTIGSPLKFAYHLLTDLSLRTYWMRGVRGIEAEEQLPRVGSAHQCFLPGMVLHIETSKSEFDKGRVEFVEKVTNLPMVPEANVFSTLEEREDGDLSFTVDVHYRLSLPGRLISPVLRFIMRNQFGGNTRLFKRFVERALLRSRHPVWGGAESSIQRVGYHHP